MRIKIKTTIIASYFLIAAFWSVLAYGQINDDDQPTITLTEIKGSAPMDGAHIAKYHVDPPAPNSGYETGALHIIYDDGTEVIEKVPPKTKADFNIEGFDDLGVSDDKRTIAWTEDQDNCCTSYSVPTVLAIYNSGKNILHLSTGLMVWFWMFQNEGKHVAAVWGTTHGPEVGDYQLYDAETGRIISEILGNAETQSLASDAPEWAKQTEQAMHQRK